MATGHFIQGVTSSNGHYLSWDSIFSFAFDPKMYDHGKLITMAYALPAVIFMVFFYTSYDICSAVMPLSKFFEDDPEAAKQQVCSLTLIEEDKAAEFVNQNRVSSLSERIDDADDKKLQVWEEIIAESPKIEDAPVLQGQIEVMWPAKILLDPRLKDFESQVFRATWATFCPTCLVLEVLGICYIFVQVYQVYWSVVYKHQVDDYASLLGLLGVMYMGLNMIVANAFVGLWRLWPNAKEIAEELKAMKTASASSSDAFGEPTEAPDIQDSA